MFGRLPRKFGGVAKAMRGLAAGALGAGLLAACQAAPITQKLPLYWDAFKPFAPDTASIISSGQPLASNAFSLFSDGGCDVFEDEGRRLRCEARNNSPRLQNRRRRLGQEPRISPTPAATP